MNISLYQILFEETTFTDTGSTSNEQQKIQLELPSEVKKTIEDTNKKISRVEKLQADSIENTAREKGENAERPEPPGSKSPSSGTATAPTGARSPKKPTPSGTPTIPQSSTETRNSGSSSNEPVTHNDLETMKKELLGAIKKS